MMLHIGLTEAAAKELYDLADYYREELITNYQSFNSGAVLLLAVDKLTENKNYALHYQEAKK